MRSGGATLGGQKMGGAFVPEEEERSPFAPLTHSLGFWPKAARTEGKGRTGGMRLKRFLRRLRPFRKPVSEPRGSHLLRGAYGRARERLMWIHKFARSKTLPSQRASAACPGPFIFFALGSPSQARRVQKVACEDVKSGVRLLLPRGRTEGHLLHLPQSLLYNRYRRLH